MRSNALISAPTVCQAHVGYLCQSPTTPTLLQHGIANPTQQFTEEENETHRGESSASIHPARSSRAGIGSGVSYLQLQCLR
jgi:hypothetical protein